MADICNPLPEDRRRVFWTTQLKPDPDGAGCNILCGVTGLALIDPVTDKAVDPYLGSNKPATIQNTDWVRGLALNILGTNGRKPDTACGYKPGSLGGHWSESFAPAGTKIGNLVYAITPQARVSDYVLLVQEYANTALQKLVSYGVAKQVNVTAKYMGSNEISLVVDILGSDGKNANVGVSGRLIENTWMWQ